VVTGPRARWLRSQRRGQGEHRHRRADDPVHAADPDRRTGRPDGLQRPRRGGGRGRHHGVIISSEQPQFLGAMVMGPLAAWIMMQLDKLWDGKIKPGFEMLVNNFSAGIASALLAVVGFFAFGPIFAGISSALGAAVDFLIARGLLPLASLIIEPPGAVPQQRHQPRRTDPAGCQSGSPRGQIDPVPARGEPRPGLGLLLASPSSAPGSRRAPHPAQRSSSSSAASTRSTSPTCSEALYPAGHDRGGMVGIFTLTIFGAGLRAPAAPDQSLRCWRRLRRQPGRVSLSVLLAATTSFIIASIILRQPQAGDGTWLRPPRPWRP
jgi:PTS system mannitol-specific IIC component